LPLEAGDKAKVILDPMNDLKDDAGDLYRHAIADFHRHPELYKSLQDTREFDEAQVAELAGMDDLVKASGCPTMDLFKSRPELVVGFDSTVSDLDDLSEIGKAVGNVISLAKYEKNYDLAHKYANALAALGYHLYQERAAYIELTAGNNFLGTGTDAMIAIAKLEKLDGKALALEDFNTLRKTEYDQRIEPMEKVLSSEGQSSIGEHAGDMFELAAGRQFERVWRVEAIRKVGRLQFNAENRADQIKAPKFLDKLAADTKEDLIIRTAATKARNMTSYDNQSQR
jgi:hypothetical protein